MVDLLIATKGMLEYSVNNVNRMLRCHRGAMGHEIALFIGCPIDEVYMWKAVFPKATVVPDPPGAKGTEFLHGLIQRSTSEFLFLGSNDIIPGKDWLDILLKAEQDNNHKPGVYVPNDGLRREHLAAHFLSTVEFLDNTIWPDETIWPNVYNRLYLDTEITIRAKTLNAFWYVSDSVLLHDHVIIGGRGGTLTLTDKDLEDKALFIKRNNHLLTAATEQFFK